MVNSVMVFLNDPVLAQQAVKQLADASIIAIDHKTTPLPPYGSHPQGGWEPALSTIRLFGCYAEGLPCFLFDMEQISWQQLTPLWTKQLVTHNAVFVMKHLLQAGVAINADCTQLQARVLHGDLYELSELAEDNGLSAYDDVICQHNNQYDQQSLSNRLHAIWQLHQLQQQELRNHSLIKPYQLLISAQPAVASMQFHGVHIDRHGHTKLIAEWERTVKGIKQSLMAITGTNLNLDSPKQLSNWLKQHLDPITLAQWPTSSTGQLKTDAGTLRRFIHHDIARHLLDYRETATKLSHFGHSLQAQINPVTGRIHSYYQIAGARTGRFTSSEPNMQNAPRDNAFRQLFTAPAGRKLIIADYSQIELRIAALLSQDPVMLVAYDKGMDLHVMTAAAILHTSPEQIDAAQRQKAKAINFGLLFGQGAKGLASYASDSYGVTMIIQEAQQAITIFSATYSRFAQWQKETIAETFRTRKSVTASGIIRNFDLEDDVSLYTAGLNTPIQGAAAEIMLQALAMLHEHVGGNDIKLVNIIHDEIVLEVAESEAIAAKALLEDAMCAGMLAVFPTASTNGLVEANIASHWE